MNTVLWVLQIIAALLYGASGTMKAFMFDKVREGVPSFGALPKKVWNALGILELFASFALIVPAWYGHLEAAGIAALVLAAESLVFVGVHTKFREFPATVMSGILGLSMAFIAYGRLFYN